MKPNLLALHTAAAFGSICLASSAFAQAQATTLKISPTGIGHMLIVPYYTAQGGHATQLNIVNVDRVNGKAVKVRFRGASNADDVFDFTLLLSPGDVWTAEVSQNPSTGYARLSTTDNSCTLPTQINRDFIGTRLNPASARPNETREGYVEILNMANIPPTSTVFAAIKHTNGVTPAPCSNGASMPAALQNLTDSVRMAAVGFANPTTGLLANWSVVHLAEATSWSGKATAILAVDASGQPGYGNKVAYPQVNGTPSQVAAGVPIANLTTDPLLISGAVPVQSYDLPDLSTPYTSTLSAAQQAALLSGAMATSSLSNEYTTDDAVQAQTDWVFSLPMRRYSVALNHTTGLPVLTTLSPPYFNASNTTVAGTGGNRRLCVTGISRTFWDRSEQLEPSFSPTPPTNLCGAVSVLSINAGNELAPSAIASSVVRQNVELSYQDGWGEITTPGIYRYPVVLGSYGLPILGLAFSRSTSTNVGAGLSGNLGMVWEHRYAEPKPAATLPLF